MKKTLKNVYIQINIMAFLYKLKELNIFREGVFISFFFILVSALMLTINYFFNVFLLSLFALIFVSLGFVILFMLLLIPFLDKKSGEIFLFVWNELIYILVGIPIAFICIAIVPISTYIIFFPGNANKTLIYCIVIILVIQIVSLIYSGFLIWLDYRKSGLPVPEKVDKGFIGILVKKMISSKE